MVYVTVPGCVHQRPSCCRGAGAVAPPASPGHHVQHQGELGNHSQGTLGGHRTANPNPTERPQTTFSGKQRQRKGSNLRTHIGVARATEIAESERDSHPAEMWGEQDREGQHTQTQILPRRGLASPVTASGGNREGMRRRLSRRESKRLWQCPGAPVTEQNPSDILSKCYITTCPVAMVLKVFLAEKYSSNKTMALPHPLCNPWALSQFQGQGPATLSQCLFFLVDTCLSSAEAP